MSVAEPEHLAWFRKAEHNFLPISNNFVSRYPDEPGGPTEVEARRAVEIATRVRDAVLQRVPR